jgi:hypothetical protein
MIAEEVLDMITTASYTKGRQAAIAMPTHRCADAAWLRALPAFMGGVSVQGSVITGDVRVFGADVRTLPGTTAWSPPI